MGYVFGQKVRDSRYPKYGRGIVKSSNDTEVIVEYPHPCILCSDDKLHKTSPLVVYYRIENLGRISYLV